MQVHTEARSLHAVTKHTPSACVMHTKGCPGHLAADMHCLCCAYCNGFVSTPMAMILSFCLSDTSECCQGQAVPSGVCTQVSQPNLPDQQVTWTCGLAVKGNFQCSGEACCCIMLQSQALHSTSTVYKRSVLLALSYLVH